MPVLRAGDAAYFGGGAAGTRLSCELLSHLLRCLTTSMEHDAESLYTGDALAALLQPLVDQVENFTGGEDAYERRLVDYVTPCVAALAGAARDHATWRTLNYQILLKTRHTSPKVLATASAAIILSII